MVIDHHLDYLISSMNSNGNVEYLFRISKHEIKKVFFYFKSKFCKTSHHMYFVEERKGAKMIKWQSQSQAKYLIDFISSFRYAALLY